MHTCMFAFKKTVDRINKKASQSSDYEAFTFAPEAGLESANL